MTKKEDDPNRKPYESLAPPVGWRLRDIERTIDIPEGFLWQLLFEDDWAFVIKAHALVEAATTHLLTQTLDRPELSSVLARLELSNPITGKLKFIKDLGILPDSYRTFLKNFSELRNQLVHDVRNTRFSFSDKYSDQESLKHFRERFGSIFTKPPAKSGTDLSQGYLAVPKMLIWSSTILVCALAHGATEALRLKKKRAELAREQAEITDKYANDLREILEMTLKPKNSPEA